MVFGMRAMAGQSARDLFSEYLMVVMSRGVGGIQDYALCWFPRLFRVMEIMDGE